MKKMVATGLMAITAATLGGCGGGSGDSETLRVGLIPNQAPDEVTAEYEPLRAYMADELGREVELFVPTGYPAVVEAMANDEIDLALFGGLTYVQARERAEVSPLVTDIDERSGDTTYTSAIIVPADSEVQSVEELEGTDFAFGSISSTSGSLYPSIMLDEAGIDYRTDLGNITYTGGHDATAAAVASGNVDAGGIEYRILLDLQESGTVEEDAVRVIQESEPVEGYPWVVRDALPEEDREALSDLFVNLEDEEILSLLGAEGYEEVDSDDYDYIEDQARELDLITETG